MALEPITAGFRSNTEALAYCNSQWLEPQKNSPNTASSIMHNLIDLRGVLIITGYHHSSPVVYPLGVKVIILHR